MNSSSEYLNTALKELFNEDGLSVIGRGLGLHNLVSKCLDIYNDRKRLVLCLNASNYEGVLLNGIVDAGCPVHLLPKSINNEISTKERAYLYRRHGAFIVTSRILIVDLLNGVVKPTDIDGLLIHDAHRVSDDSTEAFIIRIYRQHNQQGFLKAFSDDPESLSRGFGKLTSVLRALHLKKVYLWPRFRVEVATALTPRSTTCEVKVEELSIVLTPKMKVIQSHLVALIESCLVELRKCNRLDSTELSVEKALFKSFDRYLQRQLDAEWHKLSSSTKHMMGDIRTLRNLLDHLVRLDACTFYLLLLQLQSSSLPSTSPWLMTSPAATIFATAKDRVYSLHSTGRVQLHVEDNMKWATVKHVLSKCRKIQPKGSSADEASIKCGSNVLVLAHDEQTCRDLKDYLTSDDNPTSDGAASYAKRNFMRLLHSMTSRRKRKAQGQGGGKKSGGRGWKGGQRPEEQIQFSISGSELAALEYFETSELLKQVKDSDGGGGDRKRVKRSKNSGEESGIEAMLPMESMGDDFFSFKQSAASAVTAQVMDPNGHIAIHSYSDLAQHENILFEVEPLYIVMADPDQRLIRLVERYQASMQGSRQITLYLLTYGGSSEEQRYLSAIKREKEAFKTLIMEKSTMLVPLPSLQAPGMLENHPHNSSSRSSGGSESQSSAGHVIVDVREFRSSLPSFLHEKGLKLDAVTLTVGDFIISPNICVERKSISDLFGSFKSGRLFNQSEAMSRYYRTPTLLVEFSAERPFLLQTSADIKGVVELNNICTKMCLLAMSFPQLRIIWSRDARATVDLFTTLKAGQEEPTLDTAMTFGGESVEPANQSAEEILQRLPGITVHNFRRVVEGVESLHDLFQMSEKQLAELLANPTAAKALHRFINQPAPV